jgi:hypothetical protein
VDARIEFRKRWYTVSIAILIFAFAVIACERTPWSEANSWYRVPPKEISWTFKPEIRLYRVLPASEDSAISQLETVPVVALDANRAAALTKFEGPPAKDNTLKPYLVRGVYVHEGQFGVFISGAQLLVANDSRPGPRDPMRKKPLVVWLPFPPSELYATTGSGS